MQAQSGDAAERDSRVPWADALRSIERLFVTRSL